MQDCLPSNPIPAHLDEWKNKLDRIISTPCNLHVEAKGGRLTLYDHEMGGTSHASAVSGVISNIHQQEEIAIKVPVTTVDVFACSRDIDSIDLLKVDTEGCELEVLKGAQSMIGEGLVKCIQLKFNEMNV